MSAADDLLLMQYADGELDAAADREVELHAGRDPLVRDKLAVLAEGVELVRGHLELAADAVPEAKLARVWDEIEKRLAREASATPALATAATVPAPRGPSESMAAMLPAHASLWRRAAHWADRKRGYVLTALVSAGAVAAISIALGRGGDATTRGGGAAPIDVQTVAHRPTEIESLDTPGGTGTVMRVQDEDGVTTVIWVTPDDTVEGL